jgi:DNA polymerase-1
MSKPILNILVDADMVLFASASAVEKVTKWDNNLYTLHSDCNEAIEKLESKMKYYISRILKYKKAKEYKVTMMLSDHLNFRKDIYSLYKFNRLEKRKPICYLGLTEYLEANYDCIRKPKLEADDLLIIYNGILSNPIILSGDKDLLQAVGSNYDHLKDKFTEVTPEMALYTHYFQCLLGDKTDFYDGVPGIGKVTAEKLLTASCNWETVVAAYEKKGISYDDMMVQCRVAKILTKDLWNMETNEVVLWTPPTSKNCEVSLCPTL